MNARRVRITGGSLAVSFEADVEIDRVHEPADFIRVEVELPGSRIADVRIDPLSGLVSSAINEGSLPHDDENDESSPASLEEHIELGIVALR